MGHCTTTSAIIMIVIVIVIIYCDSVYFIVMIIIIFVIFFVRLRAPFQRFVSPECVGLHGGMFDAANFSSVTCKYHIMLTVNRFIHHTFK